MQTIRPDKPDPIADDKPQGIGIILLRFFILLGIAVALLAILWSR